MGNEIKNKEDQLPPVEKMEKPADVTPVIDQATLQQILDRMSALEEDNKTLRAVVDKNSLASVEKSKKPAGLPTTRLGLLSGKVVVSWKSDTSIPTYVYNPTNPEVVVGESLKATYFFSDGTNSGVIDQRVFTQNTDRAEFEIVEGAKAIKDPETKEVTLRFVKLITSDEDLIASFVKPEDFKINLKYLNP